MTRRRESLEAAQIEVALRIMTTSLPAPALAAASMVRAFGALGAMHSDYRAGLTGDRDLPTGAGPAIL